MLSALFIKLLRDFYAADTSMLHALREMEETSQQCLLARMEEWSRAELAESAASLQPKSEGGNPQEHIRTR